MKTNTRLFLILLMGIMTASFGYAYYYSSAAYTYKRTDELQMTVRKLTFVLSEPVTASALDRLIQNTPMEENGTEKLELFTEKAYEGSESYFGKPQSAEEESNEASVIGTTYSLEMSVFSGRGLNQRDDTENNAVSLNSLITRETTYIDGITYKIVGRVSNPPYDPNIIITYRRFIELGLKAKAVFIGFEARPREKLLAYFEKSLNELDPNVYITKPAEKDEQSEKTFAADMMRAVLLILLSLVSAFALLRYWLHENIRKYSIYLYCGMRDKTLFGMVLSMLFILVLLGYAAGALLFELYLHVTPTWIDYNMTFVDRAAGFAFLYIMAVATFASSYFRLLKELRVNLI